MTAREKVLADRYLQGGETEVEMYRRVAKHISGRDEEMTEKYFDLMSSGTFLPNTPTLRNAGTNRSGFAACYVLPIGDSRTSIMNCADEMSLVHTHFGGTGFNFSPIRERGALISSTGGRACGPVAVMSILNMISDKFRQGGIREGANMGCLSIRHPDVEDFIRAKVVDGTLTHFNISIIIDDEFIGDLESGDDKAHKLWEIIVDAAWSTGDPGLLFIDNANRNTIYSKLGRMNSTNPCGEIWLYDYERCNLGSLALPKYLDEDGTLDDDAFERDIHTAVRFLDDVIDADEYFLQSIEDATKHTRRIGLGVMGWADLLVRMGISYQSDEALDLAGEIGGRLRQYARDASNVLLEERGGCGASDRCLTDIECRNIAVTCIAPTGSLSTLAGVNYGIEPFYSWETTRTIEAGVFRESTPLRDEAKRNGLLGDTALEIPWEWHVRHQAAWQANIDNAVSKTINLPSSATREDVSKAFLMAHKMGCKGITVYRNGSKKVQVYREVVQTPKVDLPSGIRRYLAHVYECRSGCGSIRVIPTFESDNPDHLYQVFVVSGGGCAASNEAMGRNISLELQENINPEKIIHVLHKVKCLTAMRSAKSDGRSCADIIGMCMDIEMRDFLQKENTTSSRPRCPECNAELEFAEGCARGTCTCGWSGCS